MPARRTLLALALLSCSGVFAQSFPTRPITIVVGSTAGSATDGLARAVAAEVGKETGQSVIVDNRAGAFGSIAAQHVARSQPDGYTVFMTTNTTQSANPHLLKKLSYDPLKDFAPVALLAKGPLLLVVNPKLGVNSIAELVALAKRQPGKLNYGSAGAGGINHLVLEQLKMKSGIFITHIPYRGIAPATLDMVSGQIEIITGTIPALAPYVRDGRIKALAVTSAGRSPALPEVPGMSESGLKGFNVLNYFGLVAPRGTPAELVQQLNAAIAKAVALPEVKERFAKDAIEAAVGTPAQLGSFLERDYRDWKAVVAAQQLKIEG